MNLVIFKLEDVLMVHEEILVQAIEIDNKGKFKNFFLKFLVLLSGILWLINLHAENQSTNFTVCFTPGQNCTQKVVERIQQAKKSLYIQAYTFTSRPLAKAIILSKNHGIDVKMILDKSQYNPKGYSSALFFERKHIPVWIDYQPDIAHNKVMIIDNETVVTGSFNFTRAAQEKNAENLLMIDDPEIAKLYLKNFKKRLNNSATLENYKLIVVAIK